MKKSVIALIVAIMMLSATVLPVLADDPGTGNSDFVIQNVDAGDVNVTVDYYDQSGANDQLGGPQVTIPGHGSRVYEAATLPVGDGWIGSVVISASKQVAAVTKLSWQSAFGSINDQITGGAYSGTYQPGMNLYFPYATVKPEGTQPGKLRRYSILTVQNAGSADANINMYYYNQTDGSVVGPIADTIQMGRSRSYNLSHFANPKVPNLGGDWQGSVFVQSTNQPIAGVMTNHWFSNVGQQWGSAYEGISSGNTVLYGPSVFRVNRESDPAVGSWVRSSNIMVQNLGDSAANVVLELFATGSTTAAMTINATIAPKTMGEFNTRFGSPTHPAYSAAAFQTALGNLFNGSVKVTCTNGQPLASVVHSFWNRPNENAASTYVAVPTGATNIYVPYAPRKLSGTAWVEWSKTAVQNLSASAANITMTFYNPNGTVALTLTDTLPGNSGDGYNTRFGSDSQRIAAAAFNALGSNFVGNLHIQSSQPIVAVVNLIGIPNTSETYNAFIPTP